MNDDRKRLVLLDPDVAEMFPTAEAVNRALRSLGKRRGKQIDAPTIHVRRGPIGKCAFERYIGIDYSGAEVPGSSLKGLRVYEATRTKPPTEVHRPQPTTPQLNPKRYWTRRELAEWLIGELRSGPRAIVGIDHAFSFPMKYFEKHKIARDWDAFLEDFHRHWPTDGEHNYVDAIREGRRGLGVARTGSATWRRLTELMVRAKSVFHFDVPGSVAKSTHAGLPWLLRMRRELRGKVHVWPFDGWEVRPGMSVVAEVYPSLWSKGISPDDRTPDQHDAYVVASWLRSSDADGWLVGYLNPEMEDAVRRVAMIEGWILGVGTPVDVA